MVRLAFSRAYRFPTGLLSDEHSRPFWLIHSAAYPLLLVRKRQIAPTLNPARRARILGLRSPVWGVAFNGETWAS
jgi:hypothetical protein